MHLIFYVLVLIFGIIAAPIYVLVRTYYGWRFGWLLLIAWLVSLAIMPGGIAAVETLAGPVISPYYSPVGLWFQAAARLGFSSELFYVIWQPEFGKWIYLAGLAVWPVHLLAMLIGSFNNLPAGRIGVGFSNNALFLLTVVPVVFIAGGYVTADTYILEAVAPVLPLMAGCFVLALMGGAHGRMLILDKPLYSPMESKTRQGAALENFSTVKHGDHVTGRRKGGLERVFAQRPEGLARLADG